MTFFFFFYFHCMNAKQGPFFFFLFCTCICWTKWSEVDQKWTVTLRFCVWIMMFDGHSPFFRASLISRQTKRRRSICHWVENTQRSKPHLISVVFFFFYSMSHPHPSPLSFFKKLPVREGCHACKRFLWASGFLKVADSPPLPSPPTSLPPVALSPYCFPSLARIHICVRPHTVFSFASICFYRVVWSEYWRTSLKKPAQPRFPACRADM